MKKTKIVRTKKVWVKPEIEVMKLNETNKHFSGTELDHEKTS